MQLTFLEIYCIVTLLYSSDVNRDFTFKAKARAKDLAFRAKARTLLSKARTWLSRKKY